MDKEQLKKIYIQNPYALSKSSSLVKKRLEEILLSDKYSSFNK